MGYFRRIYFREKERKRLGVIHIEELKNEIAATIENEATETYHHIDIKRPRFLWVNLLIVVGIMVLLIMGLVPSLFYFWSDSLLL